MQDSFTTGVEKSSLVVHSYSVLDMLLRLPVVERLGKTRTGHKAMPGLAERRRGCGCRGRGRRCRGRLRVYRKDAVLYRLQLYTPEGSRRMRLYEDYTYAIHLGGATQF